VLTKIDFERVYFVKMI